MDQISATNARWRMLMPILTLLAGGLIVVGMASLERTQAGVFEQNIAKLRTFRTARLELTSGMLRLGWSTASAAFAGAVVDGGETAAVYGSLARVDDSLTEFDTDPDALAAQLEVALANFRHVVPRDSHPVTEAEVAAVKRGFLSLEDGMNRFDSYNAGQLRALMANQRIQFNLAVAAALALLALVGLFVFRNHRRLVRAEGDLRHSRLRQTLELMPQLVWRCDGQGSCDFLSERWASFAGAPTARYLGLRWLDLVHPDDRGRIAHHWEAVSATGRHLQMEYRMRRHDGVYRWFDVRADQMFDADGQPVKWFGSCTDITERKASEVALNLNRDQLEALVVQRTAALLTALDDNSQAQHRQQQMLVKFQESEAFLRLVTDHIPGRIVYLDRDARCHFVNRAYREWFGPGSEIVLGKTMLELRGEAYFAARKPMIDAVLAGQAQAYEREEQAPDGSTAIIHMQYLPDLRDGEVRGFLTLATDISHHKRAEQHLQLTNANLAEARDRADMANRAKSDFLANMSHEIRTPMNAILGLTHMLQREIDDPSHLARLNKVATTTHHLLQVINDILDLSKIEAGKLSLECADFSLDDVLARTASMVSDMAREKGLEVTIDATRMPNRLNGDATRLMQALLNLLSNAVKFSERGKVSLQAELLREDGDAVFARFEVRDTGIGIAPDVLPLLFTPFAQADGSSTRRHGGTGLGLTITRHIAELMGGDAGGESALGRGSRFWITVRLRRAAPQDDAVSPPVHLSLEAAEAALRDNYRHARVLLAEDNPVNQEVAADLLQAAGLSVDIADDGEQAVRMARRGAYDLILMDVQMPRMDGFQATRLLRQDPRTAQLPIIAMTANAFTEDRLDSLNAGMNEHLAKPVNPLVLYQALLKWLPVRPATSAPTEAVPPPPKPVLSAEERLQGIATLDLSVLYAQCAGKPELALRVLKQFLAHYRNAGAALVDHLQQGQLEEPKRKLHSLRGAASAIGALQVGTLAGQLEAAIKADAPAAELNALGQLLGDSLGALIEDLSVRLDD